MADVSPELDRALDSDDAEALGRLIRRRRRQDFEALKGLLSPGAPVRSDQRTKALHALGQWGDPEVVPVIARLLPGLDERGRIAAIEALGRLGTPDALPVIARHANDESPHVRKFVVLALRRLGTGEARQKLGEIERSDPQEWIRSLASRRPS